MGAITVKSLGGRVRALRKSYESPRAGGATMPPFGRPAGLHMAVFAAMAASFVIMMLAYFILFWEIPDALFMVAISAGFLVIYMCLPLLMPRFELSSAQSLRHFVETPFPIWTGRISGGDAWLQICLIPLMLALAAIALCVVIFVIRP